MNKKYAPQLLRVKAIDEKTHTIRFVFSSPVVDRYGEIVSQLGWKLDNYMKNPSVLWGHDASKFPIGKGANLSIVDGNLEGDVIFAYDQNPDAAMCYELCAGGFLNAGSVGFMNLKWMYDETTDILTLLENELYEFSIVNIPANPEALAKAFDAMKAKNVDKRVLDRVKDMQKEAQEKSANRFEDLGEEQKGVEPEAEPEITAPIKTETPAEEAEEKAQKAIEVLVASSPEVIKAAVATLTEKVGPQGADTTKVEPTPAAPGRKTYSVNKINRTIRLLAKASGS